IQTCGKIFQAVGIDEMNLLIYKRLAIGKFKRWERFSFITCSIRDIPYITGLGDGGQIGGNGIFAISKVGGAHQAMSSAQFRKKMKQEDTLAESICSHFETSAKTGKGIRAAGPLIDLIRCGGIEVMFSIVKDHLKEPSILLVRRCVSILDVFEIPIRIPCGIGTSI